MSVQTHGTPASAFAAGLDRLSARRETEWSAAWLAAEHDRIAPGFRYLLATDGRGGPLAGAICFPVPHTLEHTAFKPWDLLLGPAVAGWAGEARAAGLAELRDRLPRAATDAMAAALPASYRPGVLWVDGAPETAIEAVVAAVERRAADAGAAIALFANVRDEPASEPLRLVLARRGYAPAVTAAEAVLDVRHRSLDEYLASFGPERRRSVRRERRRFLGAGVRVLAGGAELLAEDLVEVQIAHFRRFGHPTDPPSVRDRFRRLSALPGLRVLRAQAGDRVIGYASFCEQERRPRRLVSRLAAFVENDAATYFNLAYYELVAHAIAGSFAAIHYGTETYEAKVARGCRLVPLLTWVRPLTAAAAPVVEAAAFCDRVTRAGLAATARGT